MKADHRLPVKASYVEDFGEDSGGCCWAYGNWVRGSIWFDKAVADDLTAHRGSSVVIAGDHQPPVVHALAHAINQALGNIGKTVFYTEPVEPTRYPVTSRCTRSSKT